MLFRRLRGLRAQLLLWTILPFALALTIFSIAGIARHRQAMTDLVIDRDRSLTLASANRLSREIDRRAAELTLVTSAPTPASLLETFPGGVALFDSAGQLVADATPPPAWADRDEARVLAARTAAVGRPQFAGLTDNGGEAGQTLLIGAPAGAGRALIGAIPVESLPLTETGELAGIDHAGAFMILDSTGRRIHHLEHGDSAPDAALFSDLPRPPPGGAGATTLRLPDGQELIVTYAQIESPGWMLVAVEDARSMAAMSISLVEVLPAALLFVALLGLLAVSFGAANVLRPLQELDRRAARVAWGDFDAVKEPVGGVQEMEDLRGTLAQMAERIRNYQSGMRDYLSAVTRAQEEERARLARELHDDTVQSLIALKQRTQMARKVLSNDPARADGRLAEIEQMIDRELGALRQFIGNLRPIYLEDLGFVPALEMLARQIEQQTGLVVAVETQGEIVRLAPDVEVAAFRIVQQALANVAAHAHAEHAWVNIVFGAEMLSLIVRDDGMGFTPPDQPTDLARQGHFGLIGMYERALLYGGQLAITSSPGTGATIAARFPKTD